ncbi:MAG TPA: hypothetical protein VIH42_04630 [Thermoguttaceae bacterium]
MTFSWMLSWTAAGTILLCLADWEHSLVAADGPPKTTKESKTPKGRLPPYYAHVVTKQQREIIYLIQEEYRPKIEAARARLESLIKEEKEKIFAVLDEDQKKQIEASQAAAKGKKSEQKTSRQKAAETPPDEMPTLSKPDE